MMLLMAHSVGWPVARGGSRMITNVLADILTSLGGEIITGCMVTSMAELPAARAVLFDTTPRQLLKIAGEYLPPRYQRALRRFRLGAGVYKIDYALREAIPWRNEVCRRTTTVHLGGSMQEIVASERAVGKGRVTDKPFVILTQPSVLDETRAPAGQHTAWAYCHVPNGANVNMLEAIEAQIERYAPHFRDVVLARHTMNAAEMEAYNPNYLGGDINGGIQDLVQHFARPVFSNAPYRTPARGIYLCSSSTPPGGGVHGMCGYHAANTVLHDMETGAI
jgi:phytoene dehydrogenase-like protein